MSEGISEDEIIKNVKEQIQWSDHTTYKMALQGLLDLYQKEKEKNKKLENADLTNVYLSGFYDGEKKWKDKISGKIEELDIEIQQCEYADDDIEEYKNDMEKEKSRLLRDKKILQELLEENNENIN